MEEENRTLLLILQAAREEFLAKGFQGGRSLSTRPKMSHMTAAGTL